MYFICLTINILQLSLHFNSCLTVSLKLQNVRMYVYSRQIQGLFMSENITFYHIYDVTMYHSLIYVMSHQSSINIYWNFSCGLTFEDYSRRIVYSPTPSLCVFSVFVMLWSWTLATSPEPVILGDIFGSCRRLQVAVALC